MAHKDFRLCLQARTNYETLGPGPGAYTLPTTVGFNNHDTSKKRLPMYKFGGRTGLKDRNLGPGPDGYVIDNITRYGCGKGKSFTMASRPVAKCKTFGPGPGSTDVHLKPFFGGPKAPAWNIAGYYNSSNKSVVPAPNCYSVDVSPVKPRVRAFSLGPRIKWKDADKSSPGPAAYAQSDMYAILPRKPEFTFKIRTEMKNKNFGPGPDQYNLMNFKPGKCDRGSAFGPHPCPRRPTILYKCEEM